MKPKNNAVDKLERVVFLRRVVDREIHHLNYSASKIFYQPFTLELAR